MKKSFLFALAVIIASAVINFYYYPQMPEKTATHWNFRGEADSFSEKNFITVFMLPIISTAVLLLFLVIPAIDPLKRNIREFMKYYEGFIVVFSFFMFYLNLLVVYYNLGHKFNMSQMFSFGFGVLFYYVGVLLSHAKRNWSVGIRTPWTLSSEEIWNRTHRLGGKIFKVGGVIAFIGLFFPEYSLLFILSPVIGGAVYLYLYSYLEYRREEKNSI